MDTFEDLCAQWQVEGYKEGLAAGAQRGHEEGFALAKEPASALGAELGQIAGLACARLESSTNDPFAARLRRLLVMISECTLTNDEDASREAHLARIRALAASLGLRGAVPSSPSLPLDF